jgi:hypothetical protein
LNKDPAAVFAAGRNRQGVSRVPGIQGRSWHGNLLIRDNYMPLSGQAQDIVAEFRQSRPNSIQQYDWLLRIQYLRPISSHGFTDLRRLGRAPEIHHGFNGLKPIGLMQINACRCSMQSVVATETLTERRDQEGLDYVDDTRLGSGTRLD